jgi:hypothetical protein
MKKKLLTLLAFQLGIFAVNQPLSAQTQDTPA